MGGEKLLLFRQVRSGSLARPYPCLTSLLSNTSFILKPDVHVLKVNPFGDDVLHKTYIQKLKHDLVWFDRNNSCITYMNGTYSPDHNKAAVLTLCQYPRHTRISRRNFQEIWYTTGKLQIPSNIRCYGFSLTLPALNPQESVGVF